MKNSEREKFEYIEHHLGETDDRPSILVRQAAGELLAAHYDGVGGPKSDIILDAISKKYRIDKDEITAYANEILKERKQDKEI